jgi:transposase
MRKIYRVTLSQAERKQLLEMLRRGKSSALRQAHARVLLQADESEDGLSRSDAEIHEALGVAVSTIERVRQRFVEDGLEAALERKPTTRQYERLLDGKAEAHLIALACSDPPEGHAQWSVRLLADRMVVLDYVESVSRETVRRTLKKTRSSRGSKKCG